MRKRREALRMGQAETKAHRHSTNPFMVDWEPELTHTTKKLDLANFPSLAGTGLPAGATIVVPQSRDSARFSKIFREALADQVPLSTTAHKVLLFVLYQALPGNGVVWLPASEGCAFIQVKQRKSFYDGLAELIQLEFLARTEKQGFYFLNQAKCFNGSRRVIRNTFSKPR